MFLTKMPQGVRHYYELPHMFIRTARQLVKIKLVSSDYHEVTKLLGTAYHGAEKENFRLTYPKYKKLIEFFMDKGILYDVERDLLNRHQEKDYFPWVEEVSDDIHSALKRIEQIRLKIPEDFFGAQYLAKLLKRNGINSSFSPDESFSLYISDTLIVKYHLGKVGKEICISPGKYWNSEKITSQDISGRLISGFIFHCALIASISPGYPVFRINDLLEVHKKLYFDDIKIKQKEYQPYDKNKLGPTENYNVLEAFIKLYDSKIISFNNDEKYLEYKQSPLQVVTIQTEPQENYYFADISYERLLKFVSEVAFIEILKKCYHKELVLLDSAKIVYNTKHKKSDEIVTLSLAELPEAQIIKDMLSQEDLLITLYFQKCDTGGGLLYIKNTKDTSAVVYTASLRSYQQISTVILTWISMKINHVPLKNSFFMLSDLANYNLETKTVDTTAELQQWFKQVRAASSAYHPTNIGHILDKLNFSYGLLGYKT